MNYEPNISETLRAQYGQPADFFEIGYVPRDDFSLLKFVLTAQTNRFVIHGGENLHFLKLSQQRSRRCAVSRSQSRVTENFKSSHRRESEPRSLNGAGVCENPAGIGSAGVSVKPDVRVEQPAHQRSFHCLRSRSSHSARAS